MLAGRLDRREAERAHIVGDRDRRAVRAHVMRELCIGKGFLFSDRGAQALRGFEDPVQVWEVRWRED